MTEEIWDLESVIGTADLDSRESRVTSSRFEAGERVDLLRVLAKAPEQFFEHLVHRIIEFSHAESAGISLLLDHENRFVWPAVTGGLASYIGAGTPADFGPCGTVIARNAPVLFIHPERHFTYLLPITPPLEEVLLVPFHLDGKPIGTVWAVIHDAGNRFDAEDLQLLQDLSHFAASAYQVLTRSGALESVLAALPSPKPTRPITNEGGKWRFMDPG